MRWIALIGISFLAFTAFLDFTIVNTALPFIQKDFNCSVLELQWVLNIFIMALAMTMVAAGRFADLHGRKLVFFIGSAIFGFGALGGALSQNITFLIFFRAVQGIGASVLFVSSAALITASFPKKEHAHAIGIYTGITGLGLAIGPVLGGFLVGWLNWRWVFWINLPLIAIGFLCCAIYLRLPPHAKPNTKIDAKGLALLIIGLGSLIYGIIQSSNNDPFFLIYLLVGVVVLSFFIISEKKSRMPLIDFSLFKNKTIALGGLAVASGGISTIVYMFMDPLYLQNVRRLSAYEIGFMIAAIPIGQVIISLFFRDLQNWWGLKKFLVICVLICFFSVLCHRFIAVATPLGWLLIPYVLVGLNWGMINTGVIAAVNEGVPPAKSAEAMGSVFTLWNITGSIFLAISSGIFHMQEHVSFMSAFHTMTSVNVAFALLFLIAAFYIFKKRKLTN